MEELTWPVQSPDINPIAHVLNKLESGLQARPSCSTSAPDLINALLAKWVYISTDIFQSLGESLHRRPEAFIATKEEHTPY